MSNDYDCWIASQDPYYDGHDPDPEDVSTAYTMTFEHGLDEDGKSIMYLVRGLWNPYTQEFWDADYSLLDWDGNETAVKPTPELWAAADKAMINKSYEDLEEV
jgi:hypothetical protein